MQYVGLSHHEDPEDAPYQIRFAYGLRLHGEP